MKEQYENKLPNWYTTEEKKDLILSDDIDSLASCMVLNAMKDWDIQYFYRFDFMGTTNNATNEAVGVDIALCNGKTFDNHVVMCSSEDIYNHESINLNLFDKINRNNYFSKYVGSTLLTVMSLYNYPLPESELGKMMLLCVDSTYLGYYSKYGRDNLMNKHYLCDVLGYTELYELLSRHKDFEFKDISNKYKLKFKINVSEGGLSTKIDLDNFSKETGIICELPKDTFYVHSAYSNNEIPLDCDKRTTTNISDIADNPFSLVLKGRDKIKYSIERENNS